MTDPFRDDLAALAEHVHQLAEENRELAAEVERLWAQMGPPGTGEQGRSVSTAGALRAQALETLEELRKRRGSVEGPPLSSLARPPDDALRTPPRATSRELQPPDHGGLMPLTRASWKEVVALVGIGFLLGVVTSRGH